MKLLRPLSRVELITDSVLAGAVLVLALIDIGITGLGGLLAVPFFVAAMVLRRMSPTLALVSSWLGALLLLLSGQAPGASVIAIVLTVYAVAAYGSALLRKLGLVSAALGSALAGAHLTLLEPATATGGILRLPAALASGGFALQEWLLWTAMTALTLAGAWLAGLLRRSTLAAQQDRIARQLALVEVSAEQERTRIAREMHDVVAHSLAVVIAQADGARYLAEQDPAQARQALTTIASTARDALTDVRGLLAQLRHRAEPGPQPGLSELPVLFEQLRAAELGLSVQEVGEAPVQRWSAGRQLAAYRILQEALTNALRHGTAGGSVLVELDWSADPVQLRVRNEATDPGSALHRGHGLIGMAERAALAGGELHAGWSAGHYTVSASLPGDRASGVQPLQAAADDGQERAHG